MTTSRAKLFIKTSELTADDARAHDEQPLGQIFQWHGLLGRNDLLPSMGKAGICAGREPVQMMILSASTISCSPSFPRTEILPISRISAVARHVVHPVGPEQPADSLHQACDYLVLALDHGGEIGAHLARDLDPVGVRVPDVPQNFRGGDQALAGDAAPVQAGAAQLVALDDHASSPALATRTPAT